jgi:hypothetical protein
MTMSARGLLKRSIDRQIEGRQRFAYGYIVSFDPSRMRCTVETLGDTVMRRRVIQDVLVPTFTLGLKPPSFREGDLVMVVFDNEQKQTARLVNIVPQSEVAITAAVNPTNVSVDNTGAAP